MFQVIVSPAKQMRVAQDAFEVLGIPPFVRETARLHRALLDIERNEGSGELAGAVERVTNCWGLASTPCMSSSPS